MKAIWEGQTIAESDQTRVVEGNHYFPPDSVKMNLLRASSHSTVCGWKGTASYFDIVIDSEINQNAVWTYSQPLEAAQNIKGYFAFWKGVKVE